MPKLLFARPPVDAEEEQRMRKRAGARRGGQGRSDRSIRYAPTVAGMIDVEA
ncbi:hypothetical protein [Nonomuraea africana]|uniref:hypothetical protein n=1 Tax=Nonomuraea africana TaxID=46171 RepID=UPI0033E1553A